MLSKYSILDTIFVHSHTMLPYHPYPRNDADKKKPVGATERRALAETKLYNALSAELGRVQKTTVSITSITSDTTCGMPLQVPAASNGICPMIGNV